MAHYIEHIFTITGVAKRVFGLGDRQTATTRRHEELKRRGIQPAEMGARRSIRP
jgi:hypothetical protein